jgi:methionyl-tRNA formyltransferase
MKEKIMKIGGGAVDEYSVSFDRSYKFKIGYFADGPWAHETLKLLVADESVQVCFICPRNDSPDAVLEGFSKKNNIDWIMSENINSSEFQERLKSYGCDLFVSMSFNQIFKRDTIEIPRFKTINCHAGKLPFYRGRNILNWALINDENEFGITVHYVDEGIDTGDIILQRVFPITDSDNYCTLLNKAYVECADILCEAISLIKSGSAPRFPQALIHPIGFYCVQRKQGDEIIGWHQESRSLFNFIRALCSPGPVARTFLGDKGVKINKAEMIPNAPMFKGVPGSVLAISNNTIIVKTLDTSIMISEWDIDGKVKIGDRFQS